MISKERCKVCVNYTHVEDRTGKEWDHTTGWCNLPKLSNSRRRVNESSWCDMFNEADTK